MGSPSKPYVVMNVAHITFLRSKSKFTRSQDQVTKSSEEWQKVMQKAVRWPCGVCGRGVGNNIIQCTSCQKWVHRKFSGIMGSMYKVMRTFICGGCVNPVTGTECTRVDIGDNANLELVEVLLFR